VDHLVLKDGGLVFEWTGRRATSHIDTSACVCESLARL
jgi:hypothetical protein